MRPPEYYQLNMNNMTKANVDNQRMMISEYAAYFIEYNSHLSRLLKSDHLMMIDKGLHISLFGKVARSIEFGYHGENHVLTF